MPGAMRDVEIELAEDSTNADESPASVANGSRVSYDDSGSLHGYMESESMKAKEPNFLHMDEVLAKIPVGYFHYKLLLVCGLSFMADGMEVSLLSFISTCAGIEWGLTDNQIALITSVVFAGELLGTLLFGPVADKYGRRYAFIWGCMIMTIAGFMSALSFSYIFLIICRFAVGFGVGGVIVPFDLLAEFCPNSHRGTFLIYIEFFWTLGSMFVAGAAWSFLTPYGWRVLTFVTAIPVTLSCILSLVYLPESPRWLLSEGRIEEAEAAIRKVAIENGYELEPFKLNPVEDKLEDPSPIEFLTPPLQRITLPLWVVWAGFGFTYYGVILFVARVFEHDHNDDEADVCSFDYQAIFISAASEVVGCFLTSLAIDVWGRVGTQAAMYVGAGLGMMFMSLSLPTSSLIAVSLCARMASYSGNCATWVHTPELYNTRMRATGHSLANAMARIGAFFSPFLVESNRISLPGIGGVLLIVNLITAACSVLLPETTGKVLDEIGDRPRGPISDSLHKVLQFARRHVKGREKLAMDDSTRSTDSSTGNPLRDSSTKSAEV